MSRRLLPPPPLIAPTPSNVRPGEPPSMVTEVAAWAGEAGRNSDADTSASAVTAARHRCTPIMFAPSVRVFPGRGDDTVEHVGANPRRDLTALGGQAAARGMAFCQRVKHTPIGSTACPYLVGAAGTGPDRQQGPVGGAVSDRVQALAGPDTDDGPVGPDPPLLPGGAVAVEDLHRRAVSGASTGGLQALGRKDRQLVGRRRRPDLVGAAVAVPQCRSGAVCLVAERHVDAPARLLALERSRDAGPRPLLVRCPGTGPDDQRGAASRAAAAGVKALAGGGVDDRAVGVDRPHLGAGGVAVPDPHGGTVGAAGSVQTLVAEDGELFRRRR